MSRRSQVRRLKYTYMVIATTGEDDAGDAGAPFRVKFLECDAAGLPDNVKAALTKGHTVQADGACRYPDGRWVFSFGGTYGYEVEPDQLGDKEVYVNDAGMVFAALWPPHGERGDGMMFKAVKAELLPQARVVPGLPGSKKRVEVWLPDAANIGPDGEGWMRWKLSNDMLTEEIKQILARIRLGARGEVMADHSIEFELSDCVLVVRHLSPPSQP